VGVVNGTVNNNNNNNNQISVESMIFETVIVLRCPYVDHWMKK
jgi:hypothetical protein